MSTPVDTQTITLRRERESKSKTYETPKELALAAQCDTREEPDSNTTAPEPKAALRKVDF